MRVTALCGSNGVTGKRGEHMGAPRIPPRCQRAGGTAQLPGTVSLVPHTVRWLKAWEPRGHLSTMCPAACSGGVGYSACLGVGRG